MKINAFQFITTDIWRLRLRDLPPAQSFLIKHLRIIILTVRRFFEDKCPVRASSLTFFSLLSIGPLIALAFGIAKGFGMETFLETQVLNKIPAQEEVLQQITQYAKALLEETKGAVVAGFGVALLFWSVVKVLIHIEMSVNDIWKIERSRSWKRKISNYLSFIVLAPILMVIYTSIPVFLSSQITLIAEKAAIVHKISPVLLGLLNWSPYVVICGIFTFIYLIIPNTHVNFVSGLLGGIIAGTIFIAVQSLYIFSQVGITRLNPIYGSLAALPLLLIWLNLGWNIFLIGSEYAYAHQNVDNYEYEPDFSNISPYFRKLLALQILQLLAHRFLRNEPPLGANEISHSLEIPIRHVSDTLAKLVSCRLVSNVHRQDFDDYVFQPASDIHLWTLNYTIGAMEKNGVNQIPVGNSQDMQRLEEAMEKIGAVIETSPTNKLITDI
ncbi:hypothetical protein D3OALGA1CA_1633 [Olavius algarvensis associated proteobacterium Delta 3]|nr:hypothetical protein D3OALGB2SA_1603 [Olavius algarvensis associated proteobacterium Delta 3]CAB5104383.1 hypothetical protein D3OALGA1CA_1633 [Olavius algarvensis associated proteobacterium Delta 3]